MQFLGLGPEAALPGCRLLANFASVLMPAGVEQQQGGDAWLGLPGRAAELWYDTRGQHRHPAHMLLLPAHYTCTPFKVWGLHSGFAHQMPWLSQQQMEATMTGRARSVYNRVTGKEGLGAEQGEKLCKVYSKFWGEFLVLG